MRNTMWGRKDSGTVRTKRGEEARYLSPYPLTAFSSKNQSFAIGEIL
jgi:hypothetical protein